MGKSCLSPGLWYAMLMYFLAQVTPRLPTAPRAAAVSLLFTALLALLAGGVARAAPPQSSDLAKAPATSASPPQPAQPKPDELLLGMSTALSGPAAQLGESVRLGVQAGLERENRRGGIHGRKLRLVVLDDGYEPMRTGPNMRRLIVNEGVLAVVANVGTPTAVVAVPIAQELRTPLVGAYSGAGVLRRTPPERYVINYRASYSEEIGAMVDGLLDHGGYKPEEIAFFTQRDAYGDSGYLAGIAALKRHGLKSERPVLHLRYERNTLAVERAVADMLLADPQPRAVIMVGSYAPTAKFMRLVHEQGLRPQFLSVSFVGSEQLAQELAAQEQAQGKADGERIGEGLIVTQVVPCRVGGAPIVAEYLADLRMVRPVGAPVVFSHSGLEGYVVARMLTKALTAMPDPPGREALVTALEGLGSFDLGLDAPLRLGPDAHQASHTVWASVLRGGEFQPLRWEDMRR